MRNNRNLSGNNSPTESPTTSGLMVDLRSTPNDLSMAQKNRLASRRWRANSFDLKSRNMSDPGLVVTVWVLAVD